MVVIIVGDEVGVVFAIFKLVEDFRLDVVFVHAVAIAYIPYGCCHEVNHEVEVFGCGGVDVAGSFYGVDEVVGADGFHGGYLLSVSVTILYSIMGVLSIGFCKYIIYNFGRGKVYYILSQVGVKNLVYYI